MNRSHILRAQSIAKDAIQAVREFHSGVAQPEMELVLFFCSSEYDLDQLAKEMSNLFTGVQVVGCTTAGEIGPIGNCTRGLSGASFPAGSCVAVSGLIEELSHFEVLKGHHVTQSLFQSLEHRVPRFCPENCFSILLIDGMSKREEQVAYSLQHALGKTILMGGSAGDDQKYSGTYVFHNGKFYGDSAVMILISTELPFRVFVTQHFVSDDERQVVTGADTADRVVKEINGLPAAEEYARIVGVKLSDLNSAIFAASPVVVRIDGMDYVRSIQKVNADGTLTFFCAIDTGVVLRVAHGVDLVNNLEQTFAKIHSQIGTPQFVFGCDCILRSLVVASNGLSDRVGEIFKRNNTIGFNSYGEQYRGVHVNQTFTGIALGHSSD